MKILSIDAWANEDGWDWNSWAVVGDISKEDFEKLKTDKQIAVWMEENGFTTTSDMRRILIDDDQYNKVLCERKSKMPVFAIEYGPEY
jgi:hypothetical protein